MTTDNQNGLKEPFSGIWVNPDTRTITIYRGPGTDPVTWSGSFLDAVGNEFEAGRDVVTNEDEHGEPMGIQYL